MFRFGGGIKSDGWLRFGEMLTTTLPMGDFIDIPEPGEYTVTITYHPKLPIADTVAESELSGLITFRSVPFKLTVEQGPKRVIGSSKADRARALPLIRNLPDLGIVKIVGGTYDADDYEFIEPDSPAGQLLMMGWRAVPTLLESLDDEHLSAHRKAWVLSLLHSITAERDLDPVSYDGGFGNGVLPGYERRSGKYFGGSSSGGQISPRQQERLILKWRTFASEYLDLQEVNDK
jgi:hypothetical protein